MADNPFAQHFQDSDNPFSSHFLEKRTIPEASPQPQSEPGDIAQGVKRGLYQAGGSLARFGEGLSGAVGLDSGKEFFARQAESAGTQAQEYAPKVGGISDVNSVGSFADYLQGIAAEQVPNMGLSLGGALAGAKAGASMVPGALKPVGGLVGGALGAFVPSYALNTGELYGEQRENNVDNFGAAAKVGLPMAALDVIVPGNIAEKVISEPVKGAFKQGLGAGLKETAKAAGTGFVKGAIPEGATELGQEELAIRHRASYDPNYDVYGPEANQRRVEALAAGGLVGGVTNATTDAAKTALPEGPLTKAANAAPDTQKVSTDVQALGPQWIAPSATDTKYQDIRRPTWTEPSYQNIPGQQDEQRTQPYQTDGTQEPRTQAREDRQGLLGPTQEQPGTGPAVNPAIQEIRGDNVRRERGNNAQRNAIIEQQGQDIAGTERANAASVRENGLEQPRLANEGADARGAVGVQDTGQIEQRKAETERNKDSSGMEARKGLSGNEPVDQGFQTTHTDTETGDRYQWLGEDRYLSADDNQIYNFNEGELAPVKNEANTKIKAGESNSINSNNKQQNIADNARPSDALLGRQWESEGKENKGKTTQTGEDNGLQERQTSGQEVESAISLNRNEQQNTYINQKDTISQTQSLSVTEENNKSNGRNDKQPTIQQPAMAIQPEPQSTPGQANTVPNERTFLGTKNPKKTQIQQQNQQPPETNQRTFNEQASTTTNEAQEEKATPQILTTPKNKYVANRIRQEKIKRSSPGFEAAKTRIENDYEVEVDKAYASLSFEQYKALPENKGLSDEVLRESQDYLKEKYAIYNKSQPTNSPQTTGRKVQLQQSEQEKKTRTAQQGSKTQNKAEAKEKSAEINAQKLPLLTKDQSDAIRRAIKDDPAIAENTVVIQSIVKKSGGKIRIQQAKEISEALKQENQRATGTRTEDTTPVLAKDSKGKSEVSDTKEKIKYHPAIETMANDLVVGGGISVDKNNRRNKSLNPDWYKDNAFVVMSVDGKKELSKSPSVGAIKTAVKNYTEGKKLTKSQERILEAMSDIASYEETLANEQFKEEQKDFARELNALIVSGDNAGIREYIQDAIDRGDIATYEDIESWKEDIDDIIKRRSQPSDSVTQESLSETGTKEKEKRNGQKQEEGKINKPKFSKSTQTSGSTIEQIKALLPRRVNRLVNNGVLNVVQSVKDLPKELQQRGTALYHAAWHGSPHDFDKFTTQAIGTGEGAQAYGYGLYFAEAKDVAEYYKDALSNIEYFDSNRKLYGNEAWAAQFLYDFSGNGKAKRISLDDAIENIQGTLNGKIQKQIIEYANKLDKTVNYKAGKLYQVELAPQQDEYLLWDKPLSEQSEKVKKILEKNNIYGKQTFPMWRSVKLVNGQQTIQSSTFKIQPSTGNYLNDESTWVELHDGSSVSTYRTLDIAKKEAENRFAKENINKPLNGQQLYKDLSNKVATQSDIVKDALNNTNNVDKKVSDYLHSLGIRGIKYLDGTSRGKGEGAYNYVIFSDDDVSITAKYSQNLADVEALYDSKNDKLYFVADMLNKSNINSVLNHELYHRAIATDTKLQNQLETLDVRMGRRYQLAAKGKATEIENTAYQRVIASNTPLLDRAEEFQAYLVSEYNKKPESFTGAIKKWFQDLYATIRAALIRHGIFPKDITPADLNALAMYGAKFKQRQSMDKVLKSAKEVGYKGNNKGEAEEWLRAKAKGLDMSKEARMERAKAMGFDVDKVFYHGTSADFKSFNPDRTIYVTENHEYADTYTNPSASSLGRSASKYQTNQPNIIPLFINKSKLFDTRNAKERNIFKKSFLNKWGNGSDLTKNGVPDWVEAEDFNEFFDEEGYDYDSVIVDEGGLPQNDGSVKHRGLSIALFNPSKIRSIHAAFDPDYAESGNLLASKKYKGGNNSWKNQPGFDDLTDAQFETLGKIGKPPGGSFIEEAKTQFDKHRYLWAEKLKQGVFDQYDSFKSILNDKRAWMMANISNTGGAVTEAAIEFGKPFLDESGAVDVDTNAKSLGEIFEPLGEEVDRFLMWIAGNRADRLSQEDRERLFSDIDINNLKSLSNGKIGDQSRISVYQQVRKEFEDMHNAIVKIGVDTGLVSREDAAIWKDQGFYVPFYRLAEDETTKGPVTAGGLVKQQAYKKLKGADMQLNDLLSNTLMNWDHLVNASLKNQAATKALESAVSLGLAQETPVKGGKKSVFIRKNGKERWFDVVESQEGELILDSLNALNWAGLNNPAMKVMRKFKRALTVGVTASPEFKIANLLRDSIQAIAVSDMSTNIAKNLRDGFKYSAKGQSTKARMIAGGGAFGDSGYIHGADPDAIKLVLKKGLDRASILDTRSKFKAVWDKYQDFGARLENVNRMANFEQALEQGKDLLTANFEARDQLDFQRTGSFLAVRAMSQMIPFLNARLQGLNKLGRSLADEQQRKQFGAVVGSYAAISVLMYLLMKDDDDYQKAEQWERDTYHLFKVPGSDLMYRIPRPFEVGAIANMIERAVEQMADDKVHGELFVERLKHALTQTLSIDVVPQALKPINEIWANKSSFTGREIESQAMQNLSKTERRKAWTSQTAIGLSNAMDSILWDEVTLSPIQVEHLVNGYLGWMGATTLAGIDLLARPAVGAPDRPEMSIQDYPVVGRFARDTNSRNSRFITEFYEKQKEMKQVFNDIKRYREEQEFDKASRKMEQYKDDLRFRRYFNRTQKRLSDLNKQITLINNNKSMSPEVKRRRIDKLNRQRVDLAKRAVERLP